MDWVPKLVFFVLLLMFIANLPASYIRVYSDGFRIKASNQREVFYYFEEITDIVYIKRQLPFWIIFIGVFISSIGPGLIKSAILGEKHVIITLKDGTTTEVSFSLDASVSKASDIVKLINQRLLTK